MEKGGKTFQKKLFLKELIIRQGRRGTKKKKKKKKKMMMMMTMVIERSGEMGYTIIYL